MTKEIKKVKLYCSVIPDDSMEVMIFDDGTVTIKSNEGGITATNNVSIKELKKALKKPKEETE
jgi:hypothetical protein